VWKGGPGQRWGDVILQELIWTYMVSCLTVIPPPPPRGPRGQQSTPRVFFLIPGKGMKDGHHGWG